MSSISPFLARDAIEHLRIRSMYTRFGGGEPMGGRSNRFDRLRSYLEREVQAEAPIELSRRQQRLVRGAAAFVLDNTALARSAIGLSALIAQEQLAEAAPEAVLSYEALRDHSLEHITALAVSAEVIKGQF